MSQENLIKLECTTCKRVGYHTRKNRKLKVKLEVAKHCKFCRTHTAHKETK